jgi:hypothetical protein
MSQTVCKKNCPKPYSGTLHHHEYSRSNEAGWLNGKAPVSGDYVSWRLHVRVLHWSFFLLFPLQLGSTIYCTTKGNEPLFSSQAPTKILNTPNWLIFSVIIICVSGSIYAKLQDKWWRSGRAVAATKI